MKTSILIYLNIVLLFSISCNQQVESKDDNKKENAKKEEIDPNPTVFDCKYDSIVINNYDLIGSNINDSLLILDSHSIHKIKPYLKDSLIKKYSCCPEEVVGIMSVFSEGKKCMVYSVSSKKGLVGENLDTNSTYIVPHNYQTRIKIPNKIWKSILNDVTRVKRSIE